MLENPPLLSRAGPAPFQSLRQAPPFIFRSSSFPSPQGRFHPLTEPHASSSRSQSLTSPLFPVKLGLIPPTRSQAPPPLPLGLAWSPNLENTEPVL